MSSPLSTAYKIFVPGHLENVEAQAYAEGNIGVYGPSNTVKNARNAIYVGLALEAISAYGLAYSDNIILKAGFAFTGVAGAALIGLSAKIINDHKIWLK